VGLVMIHVERGRLVKLLGLLGSEHDGEIANAGRLADRLVRNHGVTWDEMIVPARDRVLWDWRSAAREILASELGSDWERNFCWSLIARWRGPVLTVRQEATLKRIFEKYCRRAA
jgi:hypothetical protein